MKGDGTKADGQRKAKAQGQVRALLVLGPHVHHRVVPKGVFVFLLMWQISQGVSVCVVSAHDLGKCEPQPVLFAVYSNGKSSKMGEASPGIVSVSHLDRLSDPVPGARTGVIPV